MLQEIVLILLLSVSTFNCDKVVNTTSLFAKLHVTIKKPCNNGFAYNSLETCQCYCFINPGNRRECKKKLLQVVFKGLYLNHTDYEVTAEGTLFFNSSFALKNKKPFAKELYFQFDDNLTAVLCYPLDTAMHNCSREGLPEYEYQINEDLSAYVFKYDKTYPFDSYKKNTKGAIDICIYENHQTAMKIKVIASCCSAVCLVLTFITALQILNRRSNFALLCYMGMLSGYFIVMVIYFLRPKKNKYKKYFCPALPLLNQFCLLSALVWMNIQVFSIYITFSQLQPSSNTGLRKGYVIRCLCGWGIPLIFSILTLTMDLIGVPFARPQFFNRCSFDRDASLYIYLYGPVCISLGLNLIFFIAIVIKASILAKDASRIDKNVNKQMLFLAIKLIFIMGFCYISKLILWGVRIWGSFWAYFDVISTLQGVYIFIVYMCNARTFKLIKQKFKPKVDHSLSSQSTKTNMC